MSKASSRRCSSCGAASPWETIYEGFCDGIEEARETHGLEMRLTPDLTRNATPEEMDESLRYAIGYRDRGIVGVGLGAFELEYPPHLYEDVFRRARDGGLGSVPHAGELGPPDAIRDAVHLLHADRLRHGIRAIEDPDLVQELKERGTVLDVCPGVERPCGRRALAGGAPAAEARGGRRALLALHGRPADVRHRPDGGVRSRLLARAAPEGLLRGRRGRRALRRGHEGQARRDRRGLRLGRSWTA